MHACAKHGVFPKRDCRFRSPNYRPLKSTWNLNPTFFLDLTLQAVLYPCKAGKNRQIKVFCIDWKGFGAFCDRFLALKSLKCLGKLLGKICGVVSLVSVTNAVLQNVNKNMWHTLKSLTFGPLSRPYLKRQPPILFGNFIRRNMATKSRVSNQGFEGKSIVYSVEDRVGFITFNRPERYNAIDEHFVVELQKAVHLANMDDTVKVPTLLITRVTINPG